MYVSFIKVKVALFSINKTTIVDSRRGDVHREAQIYKKTGKQTQSRYFC